MSGNPIDKSRRNNNPDQWSMEDFEEHWRAHLDHLAATHPSRLRIERVRYQAEQTPAYQLVVETWADMSGEERARTWSELLDSTPAAVAEVAPVCVQCGQCCREGSPSLHTDDLDLLRAEKISWDNLVTLRRGEPARALKADSAFYTTEERIKLREKPGTNECVFFDSDRSCCTIHDDRPIQCRAQACWDDESPTLLATEPLLTRRHLFSEVQALLDLLDVHDERCSFDRMREVFEDLKQTEGRSIESVIDLLALDESFRDLVCQELHIPESLADLVFGRSLSDRVRLFGFTVVKHPDGTRTLLPEGG